MIKLTRLNGTEFYLNPDLIETVESTPDTVIKTINGKKFLALESADVITNRIIAFKGKIHTFQE